VFDKRGIVRRRSRRASRTQPLRTNDIAFSNDPAQS
jgi:hypothetical protein